MFWKLCKFEWRSSYRMYLMFYAILLICSIIIGMSSFPNVKLSGIMEFLLGLTVIIYTAGIFAIIILTIVFIFRNYIQTLYKRQAYLTHTLPIAVWQLQLVKVLSALFWIILSFLVTMLSVFLMMFFSGFGFDIFHEIYQAVVYIWNEASYGLEMTLSLFLGLLELIEMISLIYLVINFVHTVYIQRCRIAIGLATVLAWVVAQSLVNSWLNEFLLSHMSLIIGLSVFIVIEIALTALWNIASVYLIKHKMEVE